MSDVQEVRPSLADRLEAMCSSGELSQDEMRCVQRLVKEMNAAGAEWMQVRMPKVVQTFNPATSKKRLQFKVWEVLEFAEKNGLPVAMFFPHTEDITGEALVGASNGDNEFLFKAIFTMITNNSQVGLAVIKKMHDPELLRDVILKAIHEHPEFVSDVLKQVSEQALCAPEKPPVLMPGMRVRLLAPSPVDFGDQDPPESYAMQRDRAGMEAEVERMHGEEAIVKFDDLSRMCVPCELLIPIAPKQDVPSSESAVAGEKGAPTEVQKQGGLSVVR